MCCFGCCNCRPRCLHAASWCFHWKDVTSMVPDWTVETVAPWFIDSTSLIKWEEIQEHNNFLLKFNRHTHVKNFVPATSNSATHFKLDIRVCLCIALHTVGSLFTCTVLFLRKNFINLSFSLCFWAFFHCNGGNRKQSFLWGIVRGGDLWLFEGEINALFFLDEMHAEQQIPSLSRRSHSSLVRQSLWMPL